MPRFHVASSFSPFDRLQSMIPLVKKEHRWERAWGAWNRVSGPFPFVPRQHNMTVHHATREVVPISIKRENIDRMSSNIPKSWWPQYSCDIKIYTSQWKLFENIKKQGYGNCNVKVMILQRWDNIRRHGAMNPNEAVARLANICLHNQKGSKSSCLTASVRCLSRMLLHAFTRIRHILSGLQLDVVLRNYNPSLDHLNEGRQRKRHKKSKRPVSLGLRCPFMKITQATYFSGLRLGSM